MSDRLKIVPSMVSASGACDSAYRWVKVGVTTLTLTETVSVRARVVEWGLAALVTLLPLVMWTGLYDNFTLVKWDVLLVASPLIGLLTLYARTWVLPRFGWVEWGIVGCLIVVAGCHIVLFSQRMPVTVWLQRGSFLLLVFVALQVLGRSRIDVDGNGLTRVVGWLPVSVLLVSLHGLGQYLGFDPLHMPRGQVVAGYALAPSTFGNVNMTAQFLGLSIPLLLLLTESAWQKRCVWWCGGLCLTVALAFVYVGSLGCRSVYLGLGAAVLVASLVRLVNWRVGVITAVLTFALGGSVWSARHFLREMPYSEQVQDDKKIDENLVNPEKSFQDQVNNPQPGFDPFGSDKAASANLRLVLWDDALRMIADAPLLGHGPGSFEFRHVPYQAVGKRVPVERELWQSPHNEFLRIGLENGLVYLALISVWVLWLLWRAIPHWSWRVWQVWSSQQKVVVVLLPVLGAEALFQFPLDQAFASLLIAILLAHLIVLGGRSFAVTPQGWLCTLSRYGLYGVSLSLLWGAVAKFRSEALLSDPKSGMGEISIACSIYRDNWRACVFKARRELAEFRLVDAEKTLRKLLDREPYHYPAKTLWIELAYRKQDHGEFCRAVSEYDDWFQGHSSVSWAREKTCSQ